MPSQKELDDLLEKISVYQKVFGEERDALAVMRTQKSMEAKKTLADYEKRIPELAKAIQEHNATIESLDKVIETKRILFNKTEEDLQAKYADLSHQLVADYQKKYNKLDADAKILFQKQVEADGLMQELNREMARGRESIASREQDIKTREEGLAYAKKDFSDQQSAFNSQRDKTNEEMNKKALFIDESIKALEDRERSVSYREHDIFEREKRADAAIAKEKEFNARQLAQNNTAASLKAREEELNQLKVALTADQNRMNKRDREQSTRESILAQREQNIKDAEAKI